MIIYDKNEIRDILTEEQIFELLEEFGGQPEHNSNNYIISDTICHNPPGEGSHKLYYYLIVNYLDVILVDAKNQSLIFFN